MNIKKERNLGKPVHTFMKPEKSGTPLEGYRKSNEAAKGAVHDTGLNGKANIPGIIHTAWLMDELRHSFGAERSEQACFMTSPPLPSLFRPSNAISSS